jgi:inorganic pyrophosphatase
MSPSNYPNATAFLGRIVTAKIDRPVHSQHPEWGFTYPVNYGYLPDVPAPDSEDLDVYILNILEPLLEFSGECIAVIHRLNDNDDKLVLVPQGQILTDQQIRDQVHFQEQYFDSIILRERSRDLK